ncbi:lipase 1-like [Culicoides brevitarsis]|uniref:lipase 1-like n=1 Tax=Culicoides brevitarsis TaxID=469753 RepID=UPI00307BF42F
MFLTSLIISTILMKSWALDDVTTNIVSAQGYPMEKHGVETSDGFKITMHRIPFSYTKVLQDGNPKKSILLVHGILCSSAMWVTNMNNNATALAFLLSDAGYDVWMLNVRGTEASMGHTKLNIDDPKFWDFSWHEMGMEDIPAAIDYILRKTERQKIHYVGHSQGCTALLVTLSMRPEYNEKIASAYLLSPAAFMQNIRGLVPSLLGKRRSNTLSKTLDRLGWHAIVVHNNTFSDHIRSVCGNSQLSRVCANMMVNMIGQPAENVDKKQLLAFLFKLVGDNSSLKQFTHYVQMMRSAKFQMYDYGTEENIKIYQSDDPTEYNLTQITVPMTIWRAEHDPLSTEKDLEILSDQLQNAQPVVVMPGNHVDYIFEPNSITTIKDYMLETMENVV